MNTSGDEITPFYHNQVLYFSSNEHIGLGGYDIFMSKMQSDGTWSKPENLGYPINTIGDDVNFSLSIDGKTAHYSSMKEGGLGGRDIYKIDLTDLISLKQLNISYNIQY